MLETLVQLKENRKIKFYYSYTIQKTQNYKLLLLSYFIDSKDTTNCKDASLFYTQLKKKKTKPLPIKLMPYYITQNFHLRLIKVILLDSGIFLSYFVHIYIERKTEAKEIGMVLLKLHIWSPTMDCFSTQSIQSFLTILSFANNSVGDAAFLKMLHYYLWDFLSNQTPIPPFQICDI